MGKIALMAVAAVLAGAAAGQDRTAAARRPEARNRTLQAELKALEARVAELDNETARLEESVRTATIAKELMDGTRQRPPQIRTVEEQIYEDGVASPVGFDSTREKVKNKDVWLPLEPGALYRFEGEVRVEGLTGTDGVKFGAYAPVKGGPANWPGCGATGAGTFDWRRVQFSYRMPSGGAFMFSIGPSGGRGKVWFRNVRGFKVTEVEE
ncbi:MAG: hypothetical protein ACI4RD_10810 [Kiritimatiellia bacterium]